MPAPEIPEYGAPLPAARSRRPAAPPPLPPRGRAARRVAGAAPRRRAVTPTPINAFPGSERRAAALDALLRTMVERGSSDLHLRCGEPPIVRLHGEMTRLEGSAARADGSSTR